MGIMKNKPLTRAQVQAFENGTFHKHPHPNRQHRRRFEFEKPTGRIQIIPSYIKDGETMPQKTIFHKK